VNPKRNPTDNYYGQCDVPEIYRFGGLAAGGIHSLGLVICRGRLIMDFNNDCFVDFGNFALFGDQWLE